METIHSIEDVLIRDKAGDHDEGAVQAYKTGKDHPTSGFQKGDESRKETCFQALYPLYPEKQEPISPTGHCGKEGDRVSGLSKSNQTICPGIFSTP